MRDQAYKLRKLVGKPIIVGFTSGKGGVGKTNIAINIAVELAKEGLKILILDADLSLANVDLLFGIAPEWTIKDVILGEKSLKDIIVEGPHNIKIIPAASGVEELADLDDGGRERFIESFKKLEESFDFIFIDTAAGISKNVRNFLLASDEVVIITTPELTALADAYAMVKVVSTNESLSNIKILVNMVKNKEEAIETVKRIELVTAKFLGIEIENFGFIYQDPLVGKAVQEQTPFVILNPYSPASMCMRELAKKIMALKEGKRKGKGLIERLVEGAVSTTGTAIEEPKEPVGTLDAVSLPTEETKPSPPPTLRPVGVTTKEGLAREIASITGMSKKKSKLIIDKITLCIAETLGRGDSLILQGFGKFFVKMRKERRYYNVSTGGATSGSAGSSKFIIAQARRLPQFRPSSVLIKKIQNGKKQ